MSSYDFFAPTAPAVADPPPAGPAPMAAAASLLPAASRGFRLRRWPVVVGGLALVGLLVVAAVLLMSGSSKPGRPDPDTARLFGQQARTQLPAPVTDDECMAAMRAFPAIAKDDRASAAFLAGCEG